MEVDQASWFSFFTYEWLSSYMESAYKYGLKSKDLPPCSSNDRCEFAVKRMECMWKEEVQQKGLKKASLMSVVWKFIRARIFLFIFLYLVSLGLGFLGPIVFMRRLLEFCEDKNALWWHGAIWALGLVCSDLVRVIFYGMTWGAAYRTGIRLRSGLITMLYKKTTRLSTLGDKSIGEMINIFSNDSQRIFDFIAFGPIVVGGPFVASIGIGYILLTMSGLFGILTFLVFFPTQYAISILTAHLRQKIVRYIDQRVRLMNEIITSIKLIKMYAWEKPFFNAVRDIRNKEHFLLQTQAYVQSFIGELIDILPKIAVVVTFITYKGFGNDLSSAFIVWCIMDNISIPTFDLPYAITTLLEMKLVVERIKSILCLDEIKNYSDKSLDLNVVLAISNASFFWPSIGTIYEKKKKRLRRYDRTVTHKEDVQLFAGQTSIVCLKDINIVISKVA